MRGKTELVIRYLFSILVAFFLVFGIGLMNKNLAFFGQDLHFSISFPGNEQLLGAIPPIQEQLVIGQNTDGSYYQAKTLPIQDPEARISLQIPETIQLNSYDSLIAEITLQSSNNIDELDLVVAHPDGTSQITTPLYNRYLENLSWQKISDNGYTLWQRAQTYSTINEFLANPPSSPKNHPIIATFHANLNPVLSQTFLSSLPERNSDESAFPFIEGNYSAYTLLTEEDTLQIQLDVQELNYYPGEDRVYLKVYDNNNILVHTSSLEDDGIVTDSRSQYPIRTLALEVQNLDPGLYKIITGTPDTHTRLKTNQQYLVLATSPSIVDSLYNPESSPLTIYTETPSVSFPSWHIEGTAQIISFSDNSKLELSAFRQIGTTFDHAFEKLNDHKTNTITLGKNHVQLQFPPEYVIAFSESALFQPSPVSTNNLSLTVLNNPDTQYVFAKYTTDSDDDGWHKVTQHLPFDAGYVNSNSRLNLLFIAKEENNKPRYFIESLELTIL